MSTDQVVVVGIGEIGRPLYQILSRTYPCAAVDVSPVEVAGGCSVMHVCYPFQIHDFVGTTVRYIDRYRPKLTIIDSTVAPGTTRKVHQLSSRPVAYSPVRGKHLRMESDLLRYRKFVAGTTPDITQQAEFHFVRAGFTTATFRTPEIGELSKLVETTWLGVLVGWAQEVERMAGRNGATYKEVNNFIEEVDFLPSHIFPGYIGGHCVLPNIAILRGQNDSKFLDLVLQSNQAKYEESQVVTVGEKMQCSK